MKKRNSIASTSTILVSDFKKLMLDTRHERLHEAEQSLEENTQFQTAVQFL